MIQTQRLDLIPLSAVELATGLHSIETLSRKLEISLVSDLYDGRARQAVEKKLTRMADVSADQHPWYTYWLIVLRAENIGVGLVGFKGVPNNEGEVEIGYGISPLYQGQGYMTEAVKTLAAWAFTHPECKSITALLCKPDNFASHRVLEKSGFEKIYAGIDGISFRLEGGKTHMETYER